MKKILFLGLMAAAAVSFTACQKDEVLNEVPQDQPIEFGTYIGRDAQTKAHVIDQAALQNEGFGVFAYYTGQANYDPNNSEPNFMYNQKVEFNTSSWSYNPVKYWPNNVVNGNYDKVSFFAYAPYTDANQTTKIVLDNATNAGNGDLTLIYRVPSTVTDQIDLLYANNNNIDKSKQNINGNIEFQFKHALSRVGFKVQAVVDEINSEGNGIEDTDKDHNNYKDNNTYIKVNEVELYAKNNFYGVGILNLNGGNWNVSDTYRTHSSYKLTTSDFIDKFKDETETGVTNVAEQLNTADSYMMLIPANNDKIGDIKIRVKYTVITNDTNLEVGKSEIVNDITSDYFNFPFEQGKAYNFVLHLGLTSVKLSATVSNWDEVAMDKVVNVPINF